MWLCLVTLSVSVFVEESGFTCKHLHDAMNTIGVTSVEQRVQLHTHAPSQTTSETNE